MLDFYKILHTGHTADSTAFILNNLYADIVFSSTAQPQLTLIHTFRYPIGVQITTYCYTLAGDGRLLRSGH